MMPHVVWRAMRSLSTLILVLLFTAACGQGSGKPPVAGTPQPPLTGMLVDAPVSGVTFETSGGLTGTTNEAGEFNYSQLDSVTFSIGGIVLGTVPGAPMVTSVELLGAGDPTEQSVLNQLVFLQSIDADGVPSNGIEISAAAATAAANLNLDFSADSFPDELASVVAAMVGQDVALVSETDALYHFYQTYVQFGGTDTFGFDFPGFAPAGGGVVYNLAFADDFEQGDAPDPSKWNLETGYGPSNDGWGNNEWQLYTASPENVRVEDGNLVLQAQCATPPCGVRDGSITSSRINTLNKFNFKFGRVIARLKPPVGDGAWPAFWALGANFPVVGWPLSGEIDFMEMHNAFSNERTTHSTLHWCDESIQAPATCSFPEGWVFNTQNRTFPSSLGDDFHIWEAEWSEDSITVWLDGQQYFNLAIEPEYMEEFLEEFFMILNVAMGGTLGSNSQPPNGSEVFPQTMLVDYVRVFQRTGGTSSQGLTFDFEDAPESYDFGLSGGFGGGAAAVIANPVSEGINTSAQVGRMLKFDGEVFAGSTLNLASPISIPSGSSFTMKVWSPRPVMVLLKIEGPNEVERNVPHSGSGWEELTFDFGGFSGIAEGLSLIFDLGIVGDATNDPDNWTFYFDDIVFVPSSGGGPIASDDFPVDFEDDAANYNFGADGGFGGGASAVISNPVAEGINTSSQVARMLKFSGEVFAGSKLFLQNTQEVTAGTRATMKVWSPRPVMVLLKFEGADEAEVNVAHGGTGWEELSFEFGSYADTIEGVVIIFDLGIVGDATGDPDNWTFYYDDITIIPPDDTGSGGDNIEAFGGGFEAAPAAYNFGAEGGFGGGVASVVLNPVADSNNSSAQVVRMQKFDGEVFAGTKLFLPTPLMVDANSVFTMNVWSPRPVMVLLKLEGSGIETELNVAHGGTGWEELAFDFGNFSGLVDGVTIIFDLGMVGDAEGDPENWTFYFDDIQLSTSDSSGGGGDLAQIDLPITFDDPGVNYTVIDFGQPVAAMTTLVVDPVDQNNMVASTIKPLGAPVWAGTTISTEAGLATAIPFTADTTTIGIRVYSPTAGTPVRLKAENEIGGSIAVETEATTTVANEWETLVFDFSNEIEGPALDVSASYTVLSVFFNFGTDGDTAGQQTYLWDDVEFGVEPIVIDTLAPTLANVSIVSSNSASTLAMVGDTVTLSFTASEAISTPTVSILGEVADVTGSATQWQASRTLTTDDAEGLVVFSVNYQDLSDNIGIPVSAVSDGSQVTLDSTAPAAQIENLPTDFDRLDPIEITIQYSEPVIGFEQGDLVLDNATASDFASVDDDTYTVSLLPTGTGDMTVAIAAAAVSDAAGNASNAVEPLISLIDAEAPALTLVSILSDNANPQLAMPGDTVFINFTSSEEMGLPSVTINGDSLFVNVTGYGVTWQAYRTLTVDDADGVVNFLITFSDPVGNSGVPVTQTTDSSSVILDAISPTVTISDAPTQITSFDPFPITVTFSEQISGFTESDITLSAGSVSSINAIDQAAYTVLVNPGDGMSQVDISVAAGSVVDAAGNPNEVSNTVLVNGDDVSPEVLVSIRSSNASPTLAKIGDSITVEITANEVITAPQVTIAGLAADQVTGAGDVWQATRVITGDEAQGLITVSVETTDVVGNQAFIPSTTDGSAVAVDTIAPTAAINDAPASFTTLASINITAQFSEGVTGFELSDIQVANGIATSIAIVDADTYSIDVTPNGIGDLTVSVPAGAALDVAGNLSQAFDDVTVVNLLDENAPLLTSINIVSSNPNNSQFATAGDVVTLTFTANENIQTPLVSIAGVPAAVSGSGADWQANRTMQPADAETVLMFTIDFVDLGGNAGPQSTVTTDASTVTFDVTAPSLVITGAPTTVNSQEPFAVAIQFSEAVTGFDVSDVQLTNAVASAFMMVDGENYSVMVTPDGVGDITLSVVAGSAQDLAGILSLAAADINIGFDTMAPTLPSVTITSSNANTAFAGNGDIVTINFTSSEAIEIPVVSIGGVVADLVAGSDQTWIASRNFVSSDTEGAILFSIDFSDLGGNAGTQVTTTTDASAVEFDVTQPSVVINNAPASVSTLDAFNVEIVFSEDVMGFDASDLLVTNGDAGLVVANSAANYSVSVIPDGVGDLVLSLTGNAVTDLTGNSSLASSPVNVVFDANAPSLTTVVISSNNANPNFARTGDTVTVDFTANEDLQTPIVTISGSAADNVTGSGSTWQASRVMQATDAEELVGFTIDFSDLNGNDGTQVVSTTDATTVTFDITSPSLIISDLPDSFSSLDPISVTFQFNEDVSGFDLGDIGVAAGAAANFSTTDASIYTADITPDGSDTLVVTVALAAANDDAGNGSDAASESSTSALPPAWSLIWSDEFEGVAIDSTKWTARTDADCPAPCVGQQSYETTNASVSGGILTIQAQQNGSDFTSGLLDTRGNLSITYGRVEIDARMPATAGASPSLWMLPASDTYGAWPLSGEIDIANAPNLGVGGNSDIESTLHYGLPVPENTATTGSYDSPVAPESTFITYAMEWEAGEIRWFVGDQHVLTQTQDNWYTYTEDESGIYTVGADAAPFDQDFYLVLSLAINDTAGAGSTFPQSLQVDAVRVYECANAIDPVAGTGCSTGDVSVTPVDSPSQPFTEMLEVYTDAPATLSFTTDDGVFTNTLEAGSIDNPVGTVLTTNNIAADDNGNTVWNVAAAALNAGDSADVFIGSQDLTTDPVLDTGFDLTGADAAGEVLFDLRVNSATAGTQLIARLDSLGSGNFGQVTLSMPGDSSWNTYSVKVADLLANQFGTGLDLSQVGNLFALQVTGGTADIDLDNIRVKLACRDAGTCVPAPRFKELEYSQDFEGLDQSSPSAISDDNWLVFGNVFQPDGVTFIYGYGPFVAPNGTPGFSAIDAGQGGAEQGAQQLSIYNDYNNTDHSSGRRIEANVFRERTITAADVGKTLWFSFDAKRGNINDATADACTMSTNPPCDSTALAFVKTLNPSAGFVTTNLVTQDTTDLPATWGRFSISLEIDAGLVGQLLQYGFTNVASNFEPSGVFYDNLVVTKSDTVP